MQRTILENIATITVAILIVASLVAVGILPNPFVSRGGDLHGPWFSPGTYYDNGDAYGQPDK